MTIDMTVWERKIDIVLREGNEILLNLATGWCASWLSFLNELKPRIALGEGLSQENRVDLGRLIKLGGVPPFETDPIPEIEKDDQGIIPEIINRGGEEQVIAIAELFLKSWEKFFSEARQKLDLDREGRLPDFEGDCLENFLSLGFAPCSEIIAEIRERGGLDS